MLIGSPARALARVVAYAALTIPLLPVQLIGVLFVPPLARWLPVFYHRLVCTILGIKIKVRGRMSKIRPTLFVVNHVSYLDIEVLGALIPGSFIAKREVSTWPFFSWLARLQRSIFIDRRRSAARDGAHAVHERFGNGDDLILFPEGTSGDGTRVLPFRSSMLAVAEFHLAKGKPITVQPVSIAYTRLDGIALGRNWRPFYTWFGDTGLAPHAWQMAGLGEVEVMVNFHEPVDIDRLGNRKRLAEHCQKVIGDAISACNSGRFETLPPPPGATAPAGNEREAA